MLAAKCGACHGEKQKISGFSVASREELLKGGVRGPSLRPGQPSESLLLSVLDHSSSVKMPPGAKLEESLLAAVRRWIEVGAPWSDATAPQLPSGEEDTWAFRPVQMRTPPASNPQTGSKNPVDAFLDAKRHATGLPAAGRADRRTLIRRASFDLWGLPPSPADVARFEADPDPQAWPKLIDRLLASPRYAERYARHWLDVTRYADTGGFSNDFERPHAWRYRDYVVRSFANDKPFRDFIVEQIAGDEVAPEDPEKVVATGFLRMGPWEHTAMSVAAVTRQEWLDDVTHATAATFLGVTLECARCHDHKFDPIPTKDYYSIQAAFAATEFAQREAAFLPAEERPGFAAGKRELEKALAANQAKVATFDNLVRERFLAKQPAATPDEVKKAVREKRELSPEEFENYKVYQKREQLLAQSIERYTPKAFAVKNSPSAPDTFVLPVGNLQSPGEKVQPGILASANWQKDAALPLESAGRRLALARWIADEKNPLTYRVIVNRMWQAHFGKGLVETPNDFGKMGKRPTHPELLDYLTARFLTEGTSLKALHRLLMTSEAYQRASTPADPALAAKLDPERVLYGSFLPRRLEAESIRDSILLAAGELSLDPVLDAGGPGTFPEINSDIATQPIQIMGTLMPAYRASSSARERHRRTLYTFQKRNLTDPMLEVFNAPSLAESTAKRDATTIPTQAYALFNGQIVHDMALALADKASREKDALAALYARTLQRQPKAAERDLLATHLAKRERFHEQHPPAPPAPRPPLERSITSELTGDAVMVREEDPAGHLEANLGPHQVSARVRALADIALVLLNSNEFLYRY